MPVIFATDEDVALRVPADFPLLCPRDQMFAAGTDGIFPPEDRWTLRSATVDFLAQGVTPGQVVQLLKPSTKFRAPGEWFAVASVGPQGVTLRRKGQRPGEGEPPGPDSGLLSVEFLVATLAPQLARAGEALHRRIGFTDRLARLGVPNPDDLCMFRDAVVLTVLSQQYLAMSRSTTNPPDLFATKARLFSDELDDLLANLARWEPGDRDTGFHTRIGTRLSR